MRNIYLRIIADWVSGITWPAMVFIVFAVLKISGQIVWPWLWVTCPIWVYPASAIATLLFIAVSHIVLIALGVILMEAGQWIMSFHREEWIEGLQSTRESFERYSYRKGKPNVEVS